MAGNKSKNNKVYNNFVNNSAEMVEEDFNAKINKDDEDDESYLMHQKVAYKEAG